LYDVASWRESEGLTGGPTERDAQIQDESLYAPAAKTTGAIVMGTRMFDVGEGAWGENPPFHRPVFVVTHAARAPLVKEGGTTYTFVTDGLEGALQQAQAAAGDKDVAVVGGANIVQQFLRAGLLDELQIHLVPVLLGDGRRLFEYLAAEHVVLEATRAIASPGVTHLRFRVVK
jgi:dihydrofolate reductase